MDIYQEILKSWRIDIKNCGDKNNELDISCEKCRATKPEWFSNFEGIGSVISGNNNNQEIFIKTRNKGILNILFKGINEKYNDKRLKIYANYTSIKINNQEVLFKDKIIWHDNPYKIVMHVQKNQEIKIEFILQYNAYTEEEFNNVISQLQDKYNISIEKEQMKCLRAEFIAKQNKYTTTHENNYFFNKYSNSVQLEHIKKQTCGRVDIVCDGVSFPSVIIPSNNKKLYVFLSAIGKNTTPYPTFLRKSWSKYFDGICIYLDDPTRFKNNFAPAFYFGEKNRSYLQIIKKIIMKISNLYEIDNNNITFIGSSNSGYASLYLADSVEYSKSIALCPQLSLPIYFKEKNFSFERAFNISFDCEDQFQRYDVFRIYNNLKSKFFIYSNICDYDDAKQISKFLENYNVPIFQGLKRLSQNLYMLITNIISQNPHTIQPDESFCKIIDIMLDKSKVDPKICDAFIQSMKHHYIKHYYLQEIKDKLLSNSSTVYK